MTVRVYHLPDGDEITPIVPIKPPPVRLVPMTKADSEVLENVGQGLCRLGAVEAGMRLVQLSVAWKLGDEA